MVVTIGVLVLVNVDAPSTNETTTVLMTTVETFTVEVTTVSVVDCVRVAVRKVYD